MRVQFKYDESGKLGKIYLKFSSPVLKINRKPVWKTFKEKVQPLQPLIDSRGKVK